MKKTMKYRALAALLAAAMLFCASCDSLPKAHEPISILLYLREWSPVLDAIEERFPEIQLDVEYYAGASTTEYIAQRLRNGDVPDVFVTTIFNDPALQQAYLLDLSGYEFLDGYQKPLLDRCAIDGAIYLLPGPWSVRSVVYNKTLFAERGWQIPRSHQELLALFRRIRSETDIVPFAFTGAAKGNYFTLMSTLAQCGFLSTSAGMAWERAFFRGEASASDGMADGVKLLQDWVDAGAFSPESDEDYEVNLFDKLIERKAAMGFIVANQADFMKRLAETTDQFSMLPFYGDEADIPLLSSSQGFYTGLSKTLGEPKNQQKLEDALKIMSFLATPEGQETLQLGASDLSPLKTDSGNAPFYEEIRDMSARGYVAPFLYVGYEGVIGPAAMEIREAILTGGSLDNVCAVMDQAMQTWLTQSGATVLATVSEDFTFEQTTQLVADALNQAGLADLALISIGGGKNRVKNFSGVNGKLYAGAITSLQSLVAMPIRRAMPLYRLQLTGSQICTLIEQGKTVTENGRAAQFDYYWSGIDVTQNSEGKVTAVRMADGSEMDMEQTYTVLGGCQDFSEELLTTAEPLEQSMSDIYVAYLEAHSPYDPARKAKIRK